MRVVLASAVTPTIPMGLFAIADALERAGHRVRIVHRELERRVDPGFQLGHIAARDGAALVGIAAHWSHQSLAAVELAAEVRRVVPDAFIVAGGLTASAFPGEVLERVPEIDGVVRGEGEAPMVALAGELERAARAGIAPALEVVPNLAFRGADGRPRLTPMSYVARGETLGQLRFARADLLARRLDYMALDLFPGRLRPPVFLLCTGRGCSVNCTACGGGRVAHEALASRDRAIFRPIDSVVRELADVARQGYRSFYVCNDPKPNGPYFLELFEALARAGIAREFDLGFGCWGLPDRRFLEAARAAFPSVFLEISPETADEALRKRVRGFWYTNAELEAALAHVDELGIAAEVYFGFGNAGETAADFRATRTYALELARRRSTRIGVNVLALSTDPMSPLARDPEGHGLVLRARGFQGYVDALRADRALYPPAGRPPWLQNYMLHRPAGASPREVGIAGLATATEAALRARRPGLLHAAVDALGGPAAFE
ncbi:MAG TPA: radical SAM protein, partial [Planctomycetota bacterium]|nr:radical SAM protein [Planctomycetota bacterium]